MDERTDGRRDFLRTIGRGLALGATGLGVAAMVQRGRVDVTKCIDEHGPCRKCVLVTGCSLPKAAEFKRSQPHG